MRNLLVALSLALAGPAAASIDVNSAADPGDGSCNASECTLREAIALANLVPGVDEIVINVARVEPLTQLPAITDTVYLHGDDGELPVIDGKKTTTAIGLALNAGSAESVIRGVSIVGFHTGIGVKSNDNVIEACHVGVEKDGMTAGGNYNGILIEGDGNTVRRSDAGGRSIVSGNENAGIIVQGGSTGEITESYIGVGADGVTSVPNGGIGIELNGSSFIAIGAPSKGNVISGNGRKGILVEGQRHFG
jgi:CSLREA domain-containing protein